MGGRPKVGTATLSIERSWSCTHGSAERPPAAEVPAEEWCVPYKLTVSDSFGHTMGNVSVWYDEEGDYLELAREDDEGFFVDLGDGVFERVSEDEETLGFAVLNVSARKQRELPFEVTFERTPGDA